MKDNEIQILKKGLQRMTDHCLSLDENSSELTEAVHDYVDYINRNKTLDRLFSNNLQKSVREDIEELHKLGDKVANECNKIIEVLYDKTTPSERGAIKGFYGDRSMFEEYEGYKLGSITSSLGRPRAMHQQIEHILIGLVQLRGQNDFTNYIKLEKSSDGRQYATASLFSKNYPKYLRLKEKLSRESEILAWGSFDVLHLSYRAIEGYLFNESSSTDPNEVSNAFLASAYIKLKERDDAHNILTNKGIHKHIKRLTIALLNELDAVALSSKQNLKDIPRANTATVLNENTLSFDESKGILWINDISIQGFKNNGASQNHYYALKRLLEEPETLISYEELREAIDRGKSLEATTSIISRVKEKIEKIAQQEVIYRCKEGARISDGYNVIGAKPK